MQQTGTREFTFSLLLYVVPGKEPVAIGVLLYSESEDALAIRISTDRTKIRRAERPIFDGLACSVISWVQQEGATGVLKRLETTLSNSLIISDRLPVTVLNPQHSLDALFLEHVGPQ